MKFLEQYSPNGQMIPALNRAGIYREFHREGFKIGCEIGVQNARNALVMFQTIPGVKLYLVEPFKDHRFSETKWGNYHIDARKIAHKKLVGYNAKWLEMFSEEAISKVPDNSLDFVYIDGDHSYNFVMLDIILWSRKVRPGGVISGHDYVYWKDEAKVAKAVDHYVETHKIPLYYTSMKAPGDTNPSWFFVKL